MMAATAQNNNSRCFVDEETSAALSAVEKAKAAVKESSGRLLRTDLRRNKAVIKIIDHFPYPEAVHLLIVGTIACCA